MQPAGEELELLTLFKCKRKTSIQSDFHVVSYTFYGFNVYVHLFCLYYSTIYVLLFLI